MTAAHKPISRTADLTGRRLGRYEVLHLLASGGMATVYVARAQGVAGFERLVAIKVLHPHLAHDEDFISMFLDEARLAARIRHPNAVGTLDISDTQGDGYFLVMEYVEGDHFGSLLKNAAKAGQRLPTDVVARIVMDALAGLGAAHDLTGSTGQPLELVHRDVSPHNILVGADGVARITDFGVAKAQVRLSSTRDGQFKGKLSYMAPEQAAEGNADQRSDLFSMGIVLWEALTGRRLFRGENNADVLNKILNPKVPAPSTFSEALAPFDPVIERALAREAEDRFQSAEDFLEAVENAARELDGVATPRSVARTTAKWLGDKIERERFAIRTAIDAMGRSQLTPGVLPRPMEGGSQPSHPGAASLVRPIGGEELTIGAKPSTVSTAPPAEGKSGSRLWLVGLGLIVAVAIGSAGALFVFGGQGDEAPPMTEPGDSTTEATAGDSVEDDALRGAIEPAEVPVDTPEEEPTALAAPEESEEEVQAASAPETAAERRRRERRERARRRLERERRSTSENGEETPPPSGARGDDLEPNPYHR